MTTRDDDAVRGTGGRAGFATRARNSRALGARPAIIALILALVACGRDRAPRRSASAAGRVSVVGSVTTLWAARDGRAYWNRELIPGAELPDSLAALHGRRNVMLWYARAEPDSTPTPAQQAVLQRVIDARLSVRMVEPGRPEIGMMTPDVGR